MAKHGMTKTKIYYIWYGMKKRCSWKKHKDWNLYGGRGIKVSEEWQSFENFYRDMGKDFREGLSIDRIDNNGNYTKDNCRWVTQRVQQNNRRDNVKFTFNGVILPLRAWAEEIGIKRSTLAQRIYVYKWPLEKALTKGVNFG